MWSKSVFVLIIFVAISCAWGNEDSLKSNSWIPESLKDASKTTEFKNVSVDPVNELWRNPGPIGLFRFGMKRMETKACGTYDLQPGESVFIESKNFPSKFPKKQDCTWIFKATSPSSTISIKCSTFKLNKCTDNFVEITGGDFYKKYCGKQKLTEASSTDDSMTVHFSSKKNPSKGFQCIVTASEVTTTTPMTTTPTTTTTTPTTSTTTTTTTIADTTISTTPTTMTPTTTTSTTTTPMTTTPMPCDTEHSLNPGESVNIESENYPDKFPSKVHCTWNFKATSPSSTISIKCSAFKLNKCKENFLEVKGGNFESKYCGKQKLTEASSTDDSMTVHFSSKKNPSKGFQCTVTASEPPQPPCEPCGTVNRAKRIVGGEETEVNEYPWQVAIVYTGTNIVFCSGAVYNDLFVMTAAHCGVLISLTGNMADVLLEAHDLNNLESAQRIAVSEIISDGLYNAPITFDHDIALLKLASRATLSDNVKPACLPNPSNDYSGVNAIVTGWGQTAEVGSTSSVLMEVEVPVISNAACKAVYLDYITDNILCTHSPNGGKDKCFGDDGAPLVVEEDGKWVVIGVGSWGVGCGQPLYPGGYERVSKYLDFLSNNAAEGKNDLCSMAP